MPRLHSSTASRADGFSAAAGGLLLTFLVPALFLAQAPATPVVSFTQAQATEGGAVYTQQCASCHGARLDDGAAPPLIGQRFMESWSAPNRTLDDLFFIIRSTMPKNAAGTLTPAQYAAVLAHMLERNGYRAGDRALSTEQSALAALRLTRPTAGAAEKKLPAPSYIAGTGGTAPRASGPSHEDLLAAAGGRDWLMHTHDYSGTRHSPLTQITSANASRAEGRVCLSSRGDRKLSNRAHRRPGHHVHHECLHHDRNRCSHLPAEMALCVDAACH